MCEPSRNTPKGNDSSTFPNPAVMIHSIKTIDNMARRVSPISLPFGNPYTDSTGAHDSSGWYFNMYSERSWSVDASWPPLGGTLSLYLEIKSKVENLRQLFLKNINNFYVF